MNFCISVPFLIKRERIPAIFLKKKFAANRGKMRTKKRKKTQFIENGTNVFERQRQTTKRMNDEVASRLESSHPQKYFVTRGPRDATRLLNIYTI